MAKKKAPFVPITNDSVEVDVLYCGLDGVINNLQEAKEKALAKGAIPESLDLNVGEKWHSSYYYISFQRPETESEKHKRELLESQQKLINLRHAQALAKAAGYKLVPEE